MVYVLIMWRTILTLYLLRFKNWLIRKLGGRPNKKFYGNILCNNINGGETSNRYFLKNFSKEDLIDIICRTSDDNTDWFQAYIIRDKECERLTKLFSSDYYNDKELNKALHMSDLEFKNKALKREIRLMQEKAETFNNLLYATGYIVRCTGCAAGCPENYDELTEDKVKTVEMLARRLRSWWNNNQDLINGKV